MDCKTIDHRGFIETEFICSSVLYAILLMMESRLVGTKRICPRLFTQPLLFSLSQLNTNQHWLRLIPVPVICAQIDAVGNGIVKAEAGWTGTTVMKLRAHTSPADFNLSVPSIEEKRKRLRSLFSD